MKQVFTIPNQEELFKQATAAFVERLAAHGSSTGRIILGLCGGRSVLGVLGALKMLLNDASLQGRVQELFRQLEIFMVDERLVALTDSDSNFGMLKQKFLDEMLESKVLTTNQIHPFEPRPEENDFGASMYMQELKKFGGVFHGVVLGMGEDGHVAALFPHHPCLQREEKSFISFFDSPKPPSGRMSASVPLVTSARVAMLIASGESKRAAYSKFQSANTSMVECPSVFLKGVEDLIIATDL